MRSGLLMNANLVHEPWNLAGPNPTNNRWSDWKNFISMNQTFRTGTGRLFVVFSALGGYDMLNQTFAPFVRINCNFTNMRNPTETTGALPSGMVFYSSDFELCLGNGFRQGLVQTPEPQGTVFNLVTGLPIDTDIYCHFSIQTYGMENSANVPVSDRTLFAQPV